MIQAKCIEKFRDNTGKIYGYRLQDINGQVQDVQSDNLKTAIRNKQVHIVNLTLTADNRLVDSSEKQLQAKVLGKAPVTPSNRYDSVAKALVLLDKELINLGESYAEIVENRAILIRQSLTLWDLADYYDDPKYKNCKNDNEILDKILYGVYIELLNTNPKKVANIIEAWDEYESYDIFADNIKYENVKKITQSRIYNALGLVLKYAKEQKISKDIIQPLISFLAKMKMSGVASINIGYQVGNKYIAYLDSDKFGVVSNDSFTVGCAISPSDIALHKEYKGYDYVFHKDLGKCGAPEVAIAAFFKTLDNGDVQIDTKLARNGYLNERENSMGIVGYIKDVHSAVVKPNTPVDDLAKQIGNLFNNLVPKIYKIANNYQTLYSCKGFNKPLEVITTKLKDYTGYEIIDMTVNRAVMELGSKTPVRIEKVLTKNDKKYKVIYSSSTSSKGKTYRIAVDFSNKCFTAYALQSNDNKEIARASKEVHEEMKESSPEIAEALAKLVLAIRYSK